MARSGCLLALLVTSCATMHRPAASFAVRCNVPDAALLIDDVLVGRVSEWAPPGHAVRPGFHRIEIRQAGYFSHYAEIEPPAGGQALVQAQLHPLLD
jgi:hypothetical protein